MRSGSVAGVTDAPLGDDDWLDALEQKTERDAQAIEAQAEGEAGD